MGLMLNCNPTIRFNYWPGGNMDKVVDCKADGPGFKTVLNFFLFFLIYHVLKYLKVSGL